MIYASKAGARRHLVEVQENTPTVNAVGEETPAWSTVCALRAYLRPAVGWERGTGGQTEAVSSHVVETRWPGSAVAVTPLHRLKIGPGIFNVTWTDDIEGRQRILLIGCLERTEAPPET